MPPKKQHNGHRSRTQSTRPPPVSDSPNPHFSPQNQLPLWAVEKLVGMIRVAAQHGDRERALAAVESVWNECIRQDQVEFSSPISLLKLSQRTLNMLERNGIATVGALAACTKQQIAEMENSGHSTVSECSRALFAALVEAGYEMQADESGRVGFVQVRAGSILDVERMI